MRHDPIRSELRETIEAFRFDDGSPALSFARRLARENGWSVPHAERVIREYKRFTYLAVAAGHLVTPSEDVDQAWHLHLTYTRSYWGRFCRETLGTELHHEPTRGGPDETAKHRRQYAATLESYERHFGEAPPRDVWPETDFTAAPSRWIDPSRFWMIPRPRLRGRRTPLLMTAAVAAPVTAALNPLDFDGPTFLAFYAVVAGLALVAGLTLRFLSGRSEEHSEPPEVRDPYEAAYLANGPAGVVQGAFTALVRRRNLDITGGRAARGREPLSPEAPPVERALYDAIPEDGTEDLKAVGVGLRSARSHASEYRDRLREKRLLYPDPNEPLTKRWLPAGLMALVVLLGVAKIAVGLSRDRPVAFLVLLTALAAVAAVLFLVRGRRTARGKAALDALTQRHGELRARPHHDLTPLDAMLLVGMFGTATLAGSELLAAHDLRRRAEEASGLGAGSGSSGSGCGNGDGGGGGCGGGGCGGCGGGGD